jgi:hypothetical protein
MKSKKKRVMKHICLLLCLCLFGFAVLGYLTQPSMISITLTDTFHVGVWNQDFDSRLVFFNDEKYDPSNPMTHFPGSITQKAFYFSAVPGIYYRYIRTDLDTHWVFLLNLWYPFGIFGLLVIYFQLRETYYKNLPGKTKDSKDEKEDPRQS